MADAIASPAQAADTVESWGKRFHVSRSMVYRYIARGDLKAHKMGRKTLILEASSAAFIANLSALPEGGMPNPVRRITTETAIPETKPDAVTAAPASSTTKGEKVSDFHSREFIPSKHGLAQA